MWKIKQEYPENTERMVGKVKLGLSLKYIIRQYQL